ncbi:MAG: M56 family metallopeptidase [Bacteroidota bacterium]
MNYLTEHTWMQALGWTLLHSLWQASLIALIWAISRQFLKQSSAQKRYLAAMGAIFTLLLCAAITFWQLLPEHIESYSPASSGVEAMSLPTLDDIPAALLSVEASESWTDFFDSIAPWLSLLWILGAVIMGIRFSGGLWYVHRLRHTAITPLDDQWQKRANAIAKKLGLTRAWQLMESELVTQPLTLGHFKPLVLIPVGMLSGLSPEQVEAILAHEFAHIRRADFLFNLIQSLIEILFFYHPAVWWLSREIRKERELCCDDMAVAAMGDAFTYAEALTRLQLFRHSPQHFLTMQAKGKSGSFTARIHRLFAPSPSGPSLWKSFSAALLLGMAILGSGYYAYTQSHEFTQASVEESVQEERAEAELIMFSADASREDLDLFVEEMQQQHGLDLQVLESAQNEAGSFQMISLSYFNPETSIRKGYKAKNFAALVFEVDHSRENPLELGFTSKGKEEAVMETFALEPITEEVVGPPLTASATSVEDQEILTESIIAEFRLKPTSSSFQVGEIRKSILKLTGKHIYISRNTAGAITEFYQISQQDRKYGKAGFRNFKDLKIEVKKENGQEPKITISDAYGQAFWTDEITMDKLNIYPWTQKEHIETWLSELNNNVQLEDYQTDENGKLVKIQINENGNVVTSSVPCQYHLLRDENGKTLSVGVKAGPPAPKEIVDKPIFIYLDGKGLGFYDVHINDVTKTLIKEGRFKGNSDIGEIVLFTFGTRDLGSFLQERRLPPPPPVEKSIKDGDYHVYVLYTWEHLAQQFQEKGPDKHRLYIFEGGNMGFEKGSVQEGIQKVCEDKKIDPKYVTGFILNPNDAERRFGVKSVEVVEIRIQNPSELSEKPAVFEDESQQGIKVLRGKGSVDIVEGRLKKQEASSAEGLKITNEKPEKGVIEIRGNISVDQEVNASFKADQISVNTSEGYVSSEKTLNNYYFFDGKPLGYKEGEIFSVIAAEIKARNLEKLGGIVICDGEELNGKTYKTVQILSEEYEEEYYEKAEDMNPLTLKVKGMSTKPEIWLDGEQINPESLQQLDPNAIISIDVFKDKAAQAFSGNPQSKEVIHLHTKKRVKSRISAKPSAKFKPEPKVKAEPSTSLELKVSPNPSSGTFRFDFDLDVQTEITFIIRDLQGKLVYEAPKIIHSPGPQIIYWTPEEISNGIYIAQLETAEGIIASQRLVLER